VLTVCAVSCLGYQRQGSGAKRPKTEAEVRCDNLTQVTSALGVSHGCWSSFLTSNWSNLSVMTYFGVAPYTTARGSQFITALNSSRVVIMYLSVASQALQKAGEENQRLTNRIKELELRVAQLEGTSSVAKTLSNAKMMDAVVNDAIFSE
jgi:hypothetical protein